MTSAFPLAGVTTMDKFIPPGVYAVQVIDSDVIEIAKGNFQLGLKLEIIEGQFASRRFWDNLNIRNNDDIKRQYEALRAVAELCKVTGAEFGNSSDLHNKPFTVTINAKHEISDYKPIGYRSRTAEFIDDAGGSYRDYLRLAA
jgi:Protein of unknown function (DUF669)